LFLTPKDIHDKTFKRSFKGYDENEVDEFLDLIIKEFNLMIDENERLRQELIAKPIVQEYSSASTGEIKRLEMMLAQAVEALQQSKQASDQAWDNSRRAEEYAKEQEKNAKLKEFKRTIENYKSRFESLIEDQKKQLNDKYSEIVSEINQVFGEKLETPSIDDTQAYSTYPDPRAYERPVFEMPEPQAAAVEKPSFIFAHHESPAGTIEKPILEKQTQQESARPMAQPQYPQPEAVRPMAQSQFSMPEPGIQPQFAQPEAARPVAQSQFSMPEPGIQPQFAQPEAARPVAQSQFSMPEPGIQPQYTQPEPAASQFTKPDVNTEPVVPKPQFFQNAPQPEKPQFVSQPMQFSQPQTPPQFSPPPQYMQQPVQPQPVQPQPVQQQPPQADQPKYQGIGNPSSGNDAFGHAGASDNRFKPNYSEYAWLYQEKDGLNRAADNNLDVTFRNPRDKEELKRLIDEVID
jgi:cell division initiation protein